MERVNERTVVKIEEAELFEFIEEKLSECFDGFEIDNIEFETSYDGNYLKVVICKEVEF